MSRAANSGVQVPRTSYSLNKVSTKCSKRVTKPKRRDSRIGNSSRHHEHAAYNVANKQRAVFDWYERNQYDAGSIFSPEWQCRLTNWREEFDGDISRKTLHDEIASYEENPDELKFGAFFLAHPVPAFSLWNILQACYKLDDIICGTSTEKREEIATWKTLRPFEYLQSKNITSRWRTELTSFCSGAQVNTNSKFKQEASFTRLQAMLGGVQQLEETQLVLDQTFRNKEDDLKCSHWMWAKIKSAVNARCTIIEDTFPDDSFSYTSKS